jgi:hypothetical protein
VARGHLRTAGEADAVNLLLVDYAQEVLRPFGTHQGPSLGQERVDQGQAGMAYRRGGSWPSCCSEPDSVKADAYAMALIG